MIFFKYHVALFAPRLCGFVFFGLDGPVTQSFVFSKVTTDDAIRGDAVKFAMNGERVRLCYLNCFS